MEGVEPDGNASVQRYDVLDRDPDQAPLLSRGAIGEPSPRDASWLGPDNEHIFLDALRRIVRTDTPTYRELVT